MERLATGDWLDGARARRIAWVMLGATALLLLLMLLTGNGTLDAQGRPIGTDFSGVYAAGRMVLDGQAPLAWDWSAHHAVQEAVHHRKDVDFFGWHYPPPFLLIGASLATLPYLAALLVWQSATLMICLLVVRRIVPEKGSWLFALAAPVVLICLAHGHNGFLTGALLGSGLLLLDRRPLLAGLLLGCLIYKPQFAVLIPPLLLVTGNWRAIGGAALSAGGLIAVTLALWGWPVWQAFIDSLPLTRHIVIEQGATGWQKIMSSFASVRAWGAPIPLAYAVQTLSTLVGVALALWCAGKGRPAIRNAAVCAAAVLSTPYILDYDLVIVGVGIAFLVADAQEQGWRRWEKTALAAIWVTPLIARNVAEYTLVPLGLLSAVLLLALACRRAELRIPRLVSGPSGKLEPSA
jgi:hypothetical protein